MNEAYYKHYIRLDSNGSIIHYFSTAFETPQVNDICINKQGGILYEYDGITNPPIFNKQGQPLYHVTEDILMAWTDEERNTLYPIPTPPAPLEVQNRADIDYIIMMGGF